MSCDLLCVELEVSSLKQGVCHWGDLCHVVASSLDFLFVCLYMVYY